MVHVQIVSISRLSIFYYPINDRLEAGKINSETITNSPIDVHVDVEQRPRATTAKMDRILVDLVRNNIKSMLDIIDAAEYRIQNDSTTVEGLMKLVLEEMKSTAKWMEDLEPYFTK
ncbi:hypothetical protein CTI12_AA516280 [Artemisia annua]|uniref:Uncharacterized protein n=1 Tax=Artemisia annua TaxID=35608 RepID=A0A2U1L9G7_ARTAN|nr:hypothetical protein CTI12_AA516280 [Artemisia annua]